MRYLKPFNICDFQDAVKSGQFKIQRGQLVYCSESDKKNFSVYVGHTKHTIHCIHGSSTSDALKSFRAYKKRIDKLAELRAAKLRLAQLEEEYHAL
jgi:DNA integrity scanning protein DisA with diadenylate cyclase activity